MAREIDETLIAKYIAGECTPTEAMDVEDWTNASPDNKELFESLSAAWKLGLTYRRPKPDVDSEWQRLQQNIQQPATRTLSITYRNWLVAAAIMIAGLSLWLFLKPSPIVPVAGQIAIESTAEPLKKTLPDSSIVILNRASKISYNISSQANTRNINLQGEAFFNVTPDLNNPFVIEVAGLTIKVIGTEFNVRTEVSGDVEVEVYSGKVEMITSTSNAFVEKGQRANYDITTQKIKIESKASLNDIAYATGRLSFSETSLKEIATIIERTYHVKISFENDKLKECLVSGEFENKSLDFILQVIETTLGVTHQQEGDSILISGEGC